MEATFLATCDLFKLLSFEPELSHEWQERSLGSVEANVFEGRTGWSSQSRMKSSHIAGGASQVRRE